MPTLFKPSPRNLWAALVVPRANRLGDTQLGPDVETTPRSRWLMIFSSRPVIVLNVGCGVRRLAILFAER